MTDSAWASREELAYAVQRFDRPPRAPRLHIEDLAQVRGFYADEKYLGSFETVAANIFRKVDQDSLNEFCRRLVFIALSGNGDAHLKNWSLIYVDARSPSISPAYDLVSTTHYASLQGRTEDLGLSFDGSRSFERITFAGFRRLGERLGSAEDLEALAVASAATIVDHWPPIESELAATDPDVARAIANHVSSMRRRLRF